MSTVAHHLLKKYWTIYGNDYGIESMTSEERLSGAGFCGPENKEKPEGL